MESVMANRHYTDEELVERLYGLDRTDGHLDVCRECRSRYAAVEKRRSLAVSHEPHITAGFLAEQRHAVMARIEKPAVPHMFWRTAGAFAAMAVLVVGFLSFHPSEAPAPEPMTTASAITDAQLYAEISTVVETPEPLAATPIRGLFDEKQSREAVQ